MSITVALAGDTMLGRGVADRLAEVEPEELVAREVRDVAVEADLFVLNLECCVSERGQRWPDPRKPFFFRAPPAAVRTLTWLGVDCVTLANNHALDYGADALLDTREHLARAGIEPVGAGADRRQARTPAILEAGDSRLAVIGVTDHPEDFAAGPDRPGAAYAELRTRVPEWLHDLVRDLRDPDRCGDHAPDAVLVTPHWGPNMVPEPVPHVESAARTLVNAGATLIAGHSAHVFHTVTRRVLYDLGGFVDDYAVHPELRNDLGLLFLVTLDAGGPTHIEAVPLALDFCYTRLARGQEHAWLGHRLTRACEAAGSEVTEERGRFVVAPSRAMC